MSPKSYLKFPSFLMPNVRPKFSPSDSKANNVLPMNAALIGRTLTSKSDKPKQIQIQAPPLTSVELLTRP